MSFLLKKIFFMFNFIKIINDRIQRLFFIIFHYYGFKLRYKIKKKESKF